MYEEPHNFYSDGKSLNLIARVYDEAMDQDPIIPSDALILNVTLTLHFLRIKICKYKNSSNYSWIKMFFLIYMKDVYLNKNVKMYILKILIDEPKIVVHSNYSISL